MTLRLHISNHNNDMHNTTAKKNIANGVAGLDSNIKLINIHLPVPNLTIDGFKYNSATCGGIVVNPENINDGDITSFTVFNVPGDYIEIEFEYKTFINEFRFMGNITMNGDGIYKIQHYNSDDGWIDNTINITLLNIAGFGPWIFFTNPVSTTKIRIIHTNGDTSGSNIFTEAEMRGL